MNISMGVLPFSEEKKAKLKESGVLFVQEVFKSDAADLLRGIDSEDIEAAKEKPVIQSALDVWKNEVSRRGIITFCSQLDDLLGGGIEMQAITDFCGVPGSGKTQICHQLCIDVQLPKYLGGIDGQAIYIDTNFSSSKKRFEDMAGACVQHCQWMLHKKALLKQVPSVTDFMNGIHVNVLPSGTLEELLSSVYNLRDALVSLPKVRLVVIDSFSKPFLLYCEDFQRRTALIYEILNALQNLAWEFNLAIVTTSQLTTLFCPDKEFKVVPGLGQGFAHRITHRILLGLIHKSAEIKRAAQMLKSPSRPGVTAFFQVSKSGIRDEGVKD